MTNLSDLIRERAVNINYTGEVESSNVKEALDLLSLDQNDGSLLIKKDLWNLVIPKYYNKDWLSVAQHQIPFAIFFGYNDYASFYIRVKELGTNNGLDEPKLQFSTWNDLYDYINNNASITNDVFDFHVQITCYAFVDTKQSITKIYGMNMFFSTLKGRKNYKTSKVKTASSTIWPNLGTFMEDLYDKFLGYTNGINTVEASKTLWFPQNYKNMYSMIPSDKGMISFSGAISGDRKSFNKVSEVYEDVDGSYGFSVKNSLVYGLNMDNNVATWEYKDDVLNDYEHFYGNESYIRVYLLKNDDNYAFYIKPIGQDIFRIGYSENAGEDSNLFIEYEGTDSYKEVHKLTLTNNLNDNNSDLLDNGYSWVVVKKDFFKYFVHSSTVNNQTSSIHRRKLRFFYQCSNGTISEPSKNIVAYHAKIGAKVLIMPEYD